MFYLLAAIVVFAFYISLAYRQARQMDKEYKELLKKDKSAAHAAREAYIHATTNYII